ncbi:MAG: hypothetical protein COA44_01655 [Arcobacter sp.]|nr:MAG: hypothetical protein COA44_01655 [Arcobacter sp.]
MNSKNLIYTNSSELKIWLKSQWQDTPLAKSILVQIFDGSLDEKKVKEVTCLIKSYIKEAIIIGSSSCGEIIDGKMHEGTLLISITSFENTDLFSFISQEAAHVSGKNMAETLIKEDTKCIILFIDGLDYEVDEFLKSFHEAGGDKVTLVGGVSGDNYAFNNSSFIISDTQTLTKGLVAVSLDNADLHLFNAYNFGWKSIGKDMKVTRADKNRVYEIDGEACSLVYEKYLGKNVLSNTSQSLLEFPLSFDDDGLQVARSILKVNEDKSLELSGCIPEGTIVRFAVEDEKSVIETTADIYVKASIKPLESLFIYSCATRKSFFNNYLEVEYRLLSEMAPQAGFVSYGEFSYSQGKNHLFNLTSVVLGLSESKKVNTKFNSNLLHPKQLRKSVSVVSHLMEVTTQELNEQLLANKSLNILLQQYQDALDKATLVSKTDARGIITYSNKKFCDLSGYAQEELIGQPHSIVRHKDTPALVFRQMWKTLKAKEVWSGMLQNRKKDGSSYYVHATIFPILNDLGEIVEYMALREDFTSIILYEKSLEEQKLRLHHILDNQESIVALTGKDGVISFLNKKFFDAFDYTDINDFLSQHKCLCELYVNKEGLFKGCDVNCSFEAETTTSIVKEYLVDKNGKILTFRIGTKKIVLDKKTMYILTLSDITEIENARVKAEETKNIKSDFLANMSHEIRTPMNGIIGFAGLLSESILNEEQRQYINVIEHSARMLLGVVDGILDFSKLEQGKMQISMKDINLYKEMELLYMNYLPQTQEKSLVYTLELDTGISECLRMDELHLNQVLSNLINNAVKFTPKTQNIAIKLSLLKDTLKNQEIKFCVEDTGIGISSSRQETIFEAFTQEDTSTTRQFGGTGLGLSISASLVDLMGGVIKLKSNKGEGSRFSFSLTFDKCKEKIRLKKLLNNQQIFVLNKGSQSENILKYLEEFGLNASLIETDKMRKEKSAICIVFDEKEAQELHAQINKDNVLVICIDTKSNFQSSTPSLQVINCYHRCSTRLYSVLSHYALQSSSSKSKEIFDGSKLRVLVAEDNEVNQMLIEELLKKYQIKIKIVDDGKKAVKEAQEEVYDLILMDINMPELNGIEATKKILRFSSKNQDTPIVALTSNVLEKDVEEFKTVGMYSHIAKPIKNSEVLALLNNLFPSLQACTLFDISSGEITKSLNMAGEFLELPEDIMSSLFGKFVFTTRNVIKQMNQANEAQDYEELYAQAHKLKGASSSLCLQKVTDLAVLIEKLVRKKKQLDFSNEITQLEHYLESIQAYREET